MDKHSRIYVAGGRTLIGSAILRALESQGFGRIMPDEPDLTDAAQVEAFFAREKPEYVFCAAGRVGGIHTNQAQPAELMLDNLLKATHVIDAAHRHRCRKLLYLASSCTYPRLCLQPMKEEYVLTGRPEPTNEFYSVAKIAGLKLCQAYRKQYDDDFICGIPANPFGVGDDFDPASSHVIPALLRRMHEAKIQGVEHIEIWGTGAARREFIFADDLAEACIFVMNAYSDLEPINLAGATDVMIAELAEAVKAVTGFEGELRFDTSKPDGMPVKVLDSTKLQALGWRPRTSLHDALKMAHDWFVQQATDVP